MLRSYCFKERLVGRFKLLEASCVEIIVHHKRIEVERRDIIGGNLVAEGVTRIAEVDGLKIEPTRKYLGIVIILNRSKEMNLIALSKQKKVLKIRLKKVV